MQDRRVRRSTNKKIIKKRLKLIKNLPGHDRKAVDGKSFVDNMEEQPGRMRDKHPLDCGKAKCQLCHSDKIFKKGKRKQAEKIAKEIESDVDANDFEEHQLPGDFEEPDFT